jgi:hypothetical protein
MTQYTLGKNFVSTSELSEKLGIHLAAFTVLAKKYKLEEDVDFKRIYDVSKGKGMKKTLFVNTHCVKWPRKFREKISSVKTDYSSVVDFTKIKNDFPELTDDDMKILKEKIFKTKMQVGKKEFVTLDEEAKKIFKKTVYVLDTEDFLDMKEDLIGYIELTKGKYFVWY